jgi:LSU ribosomal protein L17P
MRHGVKINHLGRKTAHRNALMRNLSCQLIEHKRIVTTLAKAKALRVFIEPLLTKSKIDTTHQRRVVFSYLQNKEAIKELFSTVSAKISDRPGGYCRIIKLDRRAGDAADMALIELVDFNELYNPKTPVGETKKKTRRGRAKKSVTGTATQAQTTTSTSDTISESVAEPLAESSEQIFTQAEVLAQDVNNLTEELQDVSHDATNSDIQTNETSEDDEPKES